MVDGDPQQKSELSKSFWGVYRLYLPAWRLAHSPTATLPWLLYTLDILPLVTQTNTLRAFVIIIPCSGLTDDTSALTNAVNSHCSNHD